MAFLHERIPVAPELPLVVLVIGSVGLWVLSMRTITLGLVNDDYVHFARAKGLRSRGSCSATQDATRCSRR